MEEVKNKLGKLVVAERSAAKSWYKMGSLDIPVVDDHSPEDVRPLSKYSNAVRGLKANNQVFLYVAPEKFETAESKVGEVTAHVGR